MSDKIHEIIAAYLAGECVLEEERQEVKRWLREHAGEKDIELLQGMFRSSRLMREKAVCRKEFVLERMEKEVQRRQRMRRIRWYYSGVAVVAVLLVGCVLIFGRSGLKPEDLDIPVDLVQKMNVSKVHLKLSTGEMIELDKYQGMMIREDSVQITNFDYMLKYSYDTVASTEVRYDTLVIPRGSEYSIVLADCTKVFLNASSEIYYPVVFPGDKREVGLKGEAYFEVAKDEHRPFFVQTGDVRIRVLGTSFNVTSYPEHEKIETTLEQGRIQITNGKEQVDVVPGKQVVYDKKNSQFKMRSVDTKLYTSWKDGYYKFEQMTLEEIMETLSLWYDLNVFYVNAEVKSLEFTGRLRRYDRVEGLLRKFEQMNLVEFELNGRNVMIRKK